MKEMKMDDYEIERCAKTLIEAEAIKGDPDKMEKIQKHLKKMKKEISSIEDLRSVAQEKDGED